MRINTTKIKKFSEETLKKMSLAKLGKPSHKKGKPGNKASKETRLKMSLAAKGRTFSVETRRKLSDSRKGEN